MQQQTPQKPKQVIVLRKDLKLSKRDYADQAANASVAAVIKVMSKGPSRILTVPRGSSLEEWLDGKFTKVVLGAVSEAQLLDLHRSAESRGLRSSLIRDNIQGVSTATAIAIGPADPELLGPITGALKLM
jgi:peptidyl-tRNA hydrolase